MIVAFESLLPSFLLIALGFALARTALFEPGQWDGVERLNYYVLYPILLFVSLVRADLTSAPIGPMAAAMALGTLATAAGMAMTHRIWMRSPRIDGPAFTSHFQGAIRYHTAVALAVCGALYGPEGLALAAIGVVTIIPIVNVLSVVALSTLAATERPTPRAILLEIIRNPLIVATVAGACVNFAGAPVYPPLVETLDLLGRGALGIALLLVGAGLTPAALAPRADIFANLAIKLALMPMLMVGFALAFGVSGPALAVVALSGAMPTSSSSYVLARRLGGDAPLMAALITAQMIAAFGTLPIAVWLIGLISH